MNGTSLTLQEPLLYESSMKFGTHMLASHAAAWADMLLKAAKK
jgi:hypothetical protein